MTKEEEELYKIKQLYMELVNNVRNSLPNNPQTDQPDESIVFGHAGRIWETFNQTNVKFDL